MKMAALESHRLLKNGMFLCSVEKTLPKTTVKADDLEPALHVLHRIAKITCVGQIPPDPFHVIFYQSTPKSISVEQPPARNVTYGAE
jgi:hypothetical protein